MRISSNPIREGSVRGSAVVFFPAVQDQHGHQEEIQLYKYQFRSSEAIPVASFFAISIVISWDLWYFYFAALWVNNYPYQYNN